MKYLLVHFQSLGLLFYSASRKRTAALVAQEAEVNGEDQDSGREEEEEEEEDNLLPRRGKSKQRRIDSPSSSLEEEDPSGVRTLFTNNEFAPQEVPVFHQEENAQANEQPEDALDTSDEERSATRNQMDDKAGAGGIVFQDQQVSTSCV